MSLTNLYLTYIVPASTLIPITAGFVYYTKISKALKALLLYLVLALLINIAGITLAHFHQNNLPLLHVYTLVELVALMWYYRLAFDNKTVNVYTTVLMIAFPLYCVINFSFFQSIYTFNTYTRPIGALIIILFSGIYLAGHSGTDKKGLLNSAGRWVASGLLIYFCSSLFQFIFSNVISHNATKLVKNIVWSLHATFLMIMYICFFWAIIKDERSKR